MTQSRGRPRFSRGFESGSLCSENPAFERTPAGAGLSQCRGSYDPLGGLLPPVATKTTQSAWFFNCGTLR